MVRIFKNYIECKQQKRLNCILLPGLEELRRACAGFVQCCINVDTVCALLASAERYIQYKCTKTLVQKVISLFFKYYFNAMLQKKYSFEKLCHIGA